MRVSTKPKFKMSSQVHFVILCTHLVLHCHYPLGARVKIKGSCQNISIVLYHRTQLITHLLFRAIHSTSKGRLKMPVYRSLCHTGQRHCHLLTFQAIDGMSQSLTTSRLQAKVRNLQLHRLFQSKKNVSNSNKFIYCDPIEGGSDFPDLKSNTDRTVHLVWEKNVRHVRFTAKGYIYISSRPHPYSLTHN